jgi:tripartite ATP-independent transporter DctP family solute receptor
MRKWSEWCVVGLVALLTVTALSPALAAAPAYPKMDIKFAHAGVPGQPQTMGIDRFAELVKKRSGGAINVQVFPGNQLGSDRDLLEQIKNGTIQLNLSNVVLLANFPGWGPIGVVCMPYIVKGNTEEELSRNMTRFVRGPVFKEINDQASQQSGIRIMDMSWWFGERHLTTKTKQVAKPEDLKGLKIRTMDSPLGKAALASLGASTTPLDIGELYTALQMGVVEGQENPVNNIFARKFFEVQKYLTLTGHMVANHIMVTNDKWYQGLQPDVRELLDKAMADAGEYNNDITMKANQKGIQDLKDKGMIVTTINRAEFAEKTKDTWREFESSFGKGVYEKVKAALGN